MAPRERPPYRKILVAGATGFVGRPLVPRLTPIAIEDAIQALIDALEIPLPASASYDVPGPETLTGKEIFERIAALDSRKIPTISIPWLTPRLSALWLRLVTRADFALARELVFGLTEDLLPADRRYWELTRPPRVSFDEAVRSALDEERRRGVDMGRLAMLEEAIVRRVGPRLRTG
jgi:nucleoside-diphosphate-sugar epimerase